MSRSTDLADAVAAYLTGLSLSVNFTATREHFPQVKADEPDVLHVQVYSGPRGGDLSERGQYSRNRTIYVVVLEKITGDAATQKARADTLDGLGEEIEESLENQTIGDFVMLGYDASTARAPFNVEQLRNAGVFVSVVGFEYRE